MDDPNDDHLLAPEAYLSAAGSSQRPGTLYYPGAGTDAGPFHLFTEHATVGTIIYADYGTDESKARTFLASLQGWSVDTVERLEPKDFSAHTWNEFWPATTRSRCSASPERAFALRAQLSGLAGREVEFLFLGTEAIQTFRLLGHVGLKPTVVVLQDHGFGGNWTSFGGKCVLFQDARRIGQPELLLVAENTDPWPNYEQVSKFTSPSGQMHQHPRALFRLKPKGGS